jgi:hypothetical protein
MCEGSNRTGASEGKGKIRLLLEFGKSSSLLQRL